MKIIRAKNIIDVPVFVMERRRCDDDLQSPLVETQKELRNEQRMEQNGNRRESNPLVLQKRRSKSTPLQVE